MDAVSALGDPEGLDSDVGGTGSCLTEDIGVKSERG